MIEPQPLSKVTVRVEPLDGSPGYEITVHKVATLTHEPIFENLDDIRSFSMKHFERIVGIQFLMLTVQNEDGETYRMVRL